MAEGSAVFAQNSAHASDDERFSAGVHVDASPSELCFAIMARVFSSTASLVTSHRELGNFLAKSNPSRLLSNL